MVVSATSAEIVKLITESHTRATRILA